MWPHWKTRSSYAKPNAAFHCHGSASHSVNSLSYNAGKTTKKGHSKPPSPVQARPNAIFIAHRFMQDATHFASIQVWPMCPQRRAHSQHIFVLSSMKYHNAEFKRCSTCAILCVVCYITSHCLDESKFLCPTVGSNLRHPLFDHCSITSSLHLTVNLLSCLDFHKLFLSC